MRGQISKFFFSASYRLILNYRLGYYFSKKNDKISGWIVKYLRYKMITKRNCHISYDAVLGQNIRFPHPIGIVIGDGVIIGDNVKIWQQVTIGSHGKKGEKLSYPKIGDNVKIFAGAKIFGDIIIQDGAVIGANAVVFIDVPINGIAVGIPAKIKQK